MTITRSITTAATAIAIAVAAAAAGPAAASAPAAPQDAATQVREVCATSTYVKQRPDAIVVNTVHRGEKLELQRYSRSRAWAFTVVRRPLHSSRGWVKFSDLCAKGRTAQFAKTARYSVRIVNSLAGGDPGFLYVGGPANLTVKDTERAGQAVKVCFTPAPIERSSCRTGRTGQTIDSIAWSQPGPTQVRISIDGGPELVETVYPYAVRRAAR